MTKNTTATKRDRNDKLDKLIGKTDQNIDLQARERITTSRIRLFLTNPFFGSLSMYMKPTNADEWLPTAAVDGKHLYYNSRFIMMLKEKEVDFLIGHEIMHLVDDHLNRRDARDPQIFNIANDFAVNRDLRKHRIGEFITTVPALYDKKYDDMISEEIYEDLMKNADKIDMDGLLDQLLDEHLDEDDSDRQGGEGDQEGNGTKPGKGPAKMSKDERDQLRQEMKQNILNAAKQAEPGQIPSGVERMIKRLTTPIMPWRNLIKSNITSQIKRDYSFVRPSRRSWHMDAILPGRTPDEEIDIDVAIDMSGSISQAEGTSFLSEIAGMTKAFPSYRIRVTCFDTDVYNPQEFTAENQNKIEEYKLQGGGGTALGSTFDYFKKKGHVPKRLIVFTDGYIFDLNDPSRCPSNYCPTTFIIKGNTNFENSWGQWAHFEDYA